jgi:hypothetical protein
VSSLINTYVGNSTPQHAVTALGVHGYAPTFARKVLTYRALNQLLVQRARKGVKVGAALKKLRLPVEINPRFGVWNRKRLSVSSAPTKGLPNFLTLQSGSTGSSSLSG